MDKRETLKAYMIAVSFLGWLSVFISLFWIKPFDSLLIVGLLIILLLNTEFFPIRAARGTLTFSFPILFTLYIFAGLSLTALIFAVVIFIIGLIRKQSIKQVIFKSGKRSLSLLLAFLITNVLFGFVFKKESNDIFTQTLYVFAATGLYFFIKCGLKDIQLKFMDRVPPVGWWKKNSTDLIVFIISFFYCWLMFFLGHQDRGRIDALSFFFFFTPLVGLTLLSAIIAKLDREKRRLNMLFRLTNEIKRGITTEEVTARIIAQFREFLPMDSSIIWLRINGVWKVIGLFGEVDAKTVTDKSMEDWLTSMTETIYIANRKSQHNLGAAFFSANNKSLVFTPLYIEKELMGVWGMGSFTGFAYQKDDLLSIEALANQMAIIIKTRRLAEDQENHKILEERNRIAREIHDGIAQRIAGAVMNLEAAGKSFNTSIDESRALIRDSLVKLRGSLKDIRESIYALRPHPAEQVGILHAMRDLINTFKRENPDTDVSFQIKGEETPLGYLIENAFFNVLKEALRNIHKHARASQIIISFGYKESCVILRVKDNGRGFSLMDAMIKAKNEPHFGIINMHELADNLDATIDISSKSHYGTEITLVVPKKPGEKGGIHDKRHVSG